MLLILLVGGWLFVSSRRQQQPIETPQQAEKQPDEGERSAPSSPQPTPPSAPPPPVSAAPPVAFLALTVGGVRGGDHGRTQILVIPQGTTQAQLLLKLKDNSY